VGPPPADTATTSSPKETLAQATTSGNVQIAQEILGACGISTADALFPFDSSHLESTSRGAMDATGIDEAGWARHRRVDVMLGS
jgi:outer membrane protein OmpA-like peptidoglycan-associated protein